MRTSLLFVLRECHERLIFTVLIALRRHPDECNGMYVEAQIVCSSFVQKGRAAWIFPRKRDEHTGRWLRLASSVGRIANARTPNYIHIIRYYLSEIRYSQAQTDCVSVVLRSRCHSLTSTDSAASVSFCNCRSAWTSLACVSPTLLPRLPPRNHVPEVPSLVLIVIILAKQR
jgi:hypothetical protein